MVFVRAWGLGDKEVLGPEPLVWSTVCGLRLMVGCFGGGRRCGHIRIGLGFLVDDISCFECVNQGFMVWG